MRVLVFCAALLWVSAGWAWDFEPLWSVRVDAHGMSAPGLFDLDGDGVLEVLAPGNQRLYCFDSGGSVRWQFRPASNYFPSVSSPVAADVNNDGFVEVVFSSPMAVYALKASGDSLWRRTLDGQGAVQNCISSVALGDINRDSLLEVFAYEVYLSRLLCLDPRDGETLWTYVPAGDNRFSVGTATVADLDLDGRFEILGQVARSDGGRLYCLSDSGVERWHYDTPGTGIGGWQLASAAVADIDGDDSLEVLGTANYWGVFCLETDGSERWTLRRSEHACAYPMFADVDGDDSLEAVVVLGPSVVCLKAENGAQEWSHTVETGYYVVSSPALADFDADGRLEVVFAEAKQNNPMDSLRPMWVLDCGGNPLWHDTTGTSLADPSAADVNHDGRMDFCIGSTYRNYAVWLYGADTAAVMPGKSDWPTLQHDVWRTGWYEYQGPVVGAAEPGPVAGLSRIRVWPNPFRDRLWFRGPGRASLFDATGRMVREIESVEGVAVWDGKDEQGRDVGAGVYLLRCGSSSRAVIKAMGQ